MIHTDGKRTVANAPAAQHKPAHGGYPGTVKVTSDIREDGRCAHTGVRIPECSCLACLERLYRMGVQ